MANKEPKKTSPKGTKKNTTKVPKEKKAIVADAEVKKEDNVVNQIIPANNGDKPISISVPKAENAQNGENATNIIINLAQEKKKRTTTKKKKKKKATKPAERKRSSLWGILILLLLLALLCVFLIPYCHKKADDNNGGTPTPLWEITADGKYMYFGSYPQKLATDEELATINTENADENGYYLDTNGNKYKKVTANPYNADTKYTDNATVIENGTDYYFKVEKIKWRILQKENNTAVLFSESILDAHNYGDSQNADISEWLNNTFITNFTSSEQSIIKTGENTTNKVFLMDRASLENVDWFDVGANDPSEKREKQTTDYARAKNTRFVSAGNGWWLYSNADNLGYVDYSGYIYDNNNISLTTGGIAPTITINLKVKNDKTTTYTVKHYKQKLGNWKTTGLTAEDCTVELEYKSSAPNTSVTPSTKAYTGFTAPTAQTVTVNKNGNTVVEYFYTRNQYQVTIDKDDGIATATASGTGYNAGIAQYGATINLTATLETGYNFANWIGYKTLPSKDTSFMVDTVPTGNTITITATSTGKTYKLSFDTNTTDESAEAPTDKDVVYNNEIGTLPTPTRDGYTFDGWYKDETYTDEITDETVFDDSEFTINHENPEQEITLYAKWTENVYSIAFNGNGATSGLIEDITSITYTHNQTLPTNTFTRTGYTFAGWSKSSTGAVEYTDGQSVNKLTTENTATVTLYAVWTANTNTAYKVEHYTEKLDGTFELEDTDNLTGETATTANATAKTIIGFTHTIIEGSSKESEIITADGNLTLKVYYKRITSTLTLSAGTGIATVSATGEGVTENSGIYTIKYGAIVTLSANASDGYTFSGWTVVNGSATISSGTYTHGTNNVEIKATATANTYTITFSGNATDDTISISSTSANVTYATAIGTLPTATRTGYEFDGWFVETSGTTQITATTELNSTNFATIDHTNKTLTVYAKWTACTYGEWQHDEDEHWKVCSNCNAETAHVAHTFKNGICDVCEYARDELSFTYLSATDTYEVAGKGRIKGTAISIPATYDDGTHGSKSVTGVGANAFKDDTTITSVTFPASITSIGENAFYGCTGFDTLALSSTALTTIGKSSFRGCTGLTSVTFPTSLENFGQYSFNGCTGLESINLSSTAVSTIGSNAFNGCTGLESVTFPTTTLSTIDSYAFNGCSSLASVTMPNSVTSVKDSAFLGCTSLASVTLSTGLEMVDQYVFFNCSSLTNITIPSNIKIIKNGAFNNCSALTTINFEEGLETIDGSCFVNCTSLDNVVLPSTVEIIELQTFGDCSNLTSIVIPLNVTKIGTNAFAGCNSLNKVYYGGSSYTEWDNITVQSGNNKLLYATQYFYSETQPTEFGQYWHFVDGVPTEWPATVNYSVQHYKEKLDGTFEPAETENLTGADGTTANATIKTYDGFVHDTTNADRRESGTITSYQTLTLKVYYKRVTSTLTLTKGTGISSVSASGDGVTENSGTYTVKYDATVTLTATASTGYTFNNFTSSDVTISSNSYTHNTTESVAITANATESTYTIAFNNNGGTGEMASLTNVNYSASTTLTTNTFTRTGYTFLGWATSSTATTATYTDGQSVNKLATGGTVTLYAVWQDNSSESSGSGGE